MLTFRINDTHFRTSLQAPLTNSVPLVFIYYTTNICSYYMQEVCKDATIFQRSADRTRLHGLLHRFADRARLDGLLHSTQTVLGYTGFCDPFCGMITLVVQSGSQGPALALSSE